MFELGTDSTPICHMLEVIQLFQRFDLIVLNADVLVADEREPEHVMRQ
jgi:hypothetical protein